MAKSGRPGEAPLGRKESLREANHLMERDFEPRAKTNSRQTQDKLKTSSRQSQDNRKINLNHCIIQLETKTSKSLRRGIENQWVRIDTFIILVVSATCRNLHFWWLKCRAIVSCCRQPVTHSAHHVFPAGRSPRS